MTTNLREETFEDWNLVISYDKDIYEPLYEILIEKIEKRIDEIKYWHLNPKWEEGFGMALSTVKEMLRDKK
jgi:hypothetical protein